MPSVSATEELIGGDLLPGEQVEVLLQDVGVWT